MPKTLKLLLAAISLMALCACNLPVGTLQTGTSPGETTANLVSTGVALTLSALTQAAPIPSLAATPTAITPTATQSNPATATITSTPTLTPTATNTLAPTDTPLPLPGTIQGGISGYPYGSLPRLTIVAYGQEPPYNYSYIITTSGDTSFSMSSSYLLPGKYQVVAYDSSDHRGGCASLVTVVSDQTVSCNISSWGSGYRSKPSGVPSP